MSAPRACASGQPELTYIWRRDTRSGLWRVARDSLPKNIDAWLKLLRDTEPGVDFKASTSLRADLARQPALRRRALGRLLSSGLRPEGACPNLVRAIACSSG